MSKRMENAARTAETEVFMKLDIREKIIICLAVATDICFFIQCICSQTTQGVIKESFIIFCEVRF